MSRRRIAVLSALGLLALLLGMVVVLVYSPLGVNLLQTRMQTVLPGVSIARVEGSLGRSFRIHELRYENERISLHIARAIVTPRVFGSLGGVIGIEALDAEGVHLVIKPQTRSDGRPVPALPAIDASGVRIRDASVTLADGRVVRLSSIAGGFSSRGTVATLRTLQVRGVDSRIDGDIAFDVNDLLPRSGNLRADILWDELRYTGSLAANTRGSDVETRLAFAAPLRGTATLRYPAREPRHSWRAHLEVPAQQTQILPESMRAEPFALTLEVAGGRGRVGIEGNATIAGRTLGITDGRVAVEPKMLRVEQLVIEERGRPGSIGIAGTIPRDGTALALDLTLEAVDPQWQELQARIDGKVAVRGVWPGVALQPQLRLAVPDKPVADISGKVRMEPETFVLEPLEIAVGGGMLVAEGAVPRAPGVPWTLQLAADDFDPGVVLAGFDGKLDARMTIGLAGVGEALDGRIEIESLEGELRGRSVTARGSVHVAHGALVAADLTARSGAAALTIEGDEGEGRPLHATLSAPALGDIAPGWQGAAEASLTRVGAALYDFSLTLHQASLEGIVAGELQAQGRFDRARGVPVHATLAASGLALAGRNFDSVRLEIRTEDDALVATGAAKAGESGLTLALRGRRAGESLSGVVERLDLTRGEHVLATLAQDAPWRWQGSEWSVDPLCLAAEGGGACLKIVHGAEGGEAAGSFERLTIAALLALWKPDLAALSGEVSGTATVRWSDQGLTAARMDLRSEQGRVALPERNDVEFGYRALVLAVDWSQAGGNATISADLDPSGRIEGRVTCAGDVGAACVLNGQVEARIDDLAWLEALTPELMDTQGHAAGRLVVSGTPAAPLLSGNIRIEDFVGYVPRLAIKLQRGEFTLEATRERSLTLAGSVWSGDARLHLDGRIDPAHPEATVLKLSGENVLIANTPATRVRASPALELRRRDEEWQLSGRIAVPEARIDVSDRAVAAVRSNDVVVLDDPPRDTGAEQPWNASITVALGDDVRVEGLGFDGKVRGELAIRQRRNGEAIASGHVGITGRYEAYGQRLKIIRGQLLYANTPLDNPTLSIRAERALRDATAGVDVGGTAQQPELQVYSRPAMSESEALALLVTGRPLREVRSSERDSLGSAAVMLGTVGGDMLAQSIGGPLGLDEIGIGAGTGLDGAAFTFGKYLSPRLFVGYGIGLLTRGEIFTVRFRLTDHFELEAQSGAETRAALNYRIER